MATAAILGAAALGAGGQIGAAALAGGGDGVDQKKSSFLPNLDPATALATFDALAQAGIVRPDLLAAASPLSTGLASIVASLPRSNPKDLADRLNSALEQVRSGVPITELKGKDRTILQQLLQVTGFSADDQGVQQFLQAQSSFEEQANNQIQRATALSSLTQEGRAAATRNLANLARDLPSATAGDIEELRGLERDRILRELEDTETTFLRRANAGGFNPAGGLEQIADLRQDASLDALSRAISLLGGQQSLAGNAISLNQGILQPTQDNLARLAQLRLGAQSNAASIAAGQETAALNAAQGAQQFNAGLLASGISGASNAAASGLNNFASLQFARQLANAPGTSVRRASANDLFLNPSLGAFGAGALLG